ncbi:pentapeptide repeat-containing protein [Thermomonospora umbrina]|uniref:Uncharacterized protein YjbI with pentapeptide repeats n=1 Tax=Thermomonospora umbrina TaxID=111806 RepID=A0A3D9SLQ7_9ACTN|nr:pentapeptide repeat-containing protein [Thermomonospora umbrina]REE96657.1 uncharacterized protein YjbI with pentapeptide repeats [Thermomonospora umbrina]
MNASPQADACQAHTLGNPESVCGAAAVTDRQCLAHLTPQARAEYLAALSPGADVHAPGVTFTRELLVELLTALKDDHGRTQIGAANFDGAIFVEDADFSHANFAGEVWFTQVTFTASANFGGATFAEDTHFSNTTFQRTTDYAGAAFAGEANFDNTTFHGVSFWKATFDGVASFSHAAFAEKDAIFTGTIFAEKAWFGGSRFARNGNFIQARFARRITFLQAFFEMHANFHQAHFEGPATFTQTTVYQTAIFKESTIDHELQVEALAKGIDAKSLRGEGRLSLRLRAAEVDLTDSVLAGPIAVHGLQDKIYATNESDFPERKGGPLPSVRVLSLQRVDAASVTLTDVDLRNCQFAGLHRTDQIVMDGQCLFTDGPRGRRRVLIEEHHWRARHPRRRRRNQNVVGGWTEAPRNVKQIGPARLEAQYRQLRKALEDSKNEPGAADFYYGEMEMRRAAAHGTERMLLWLYWLVSGYGLRAFRALATLVVVVAALALAMQHAGFPGPHPSYLDALLYAFRSAFAIDIKTSTVPEAVTRWGQVIRIALRIAGPLFIGLAALAIRNRVKR